MLSGICFLYNNPSTFILLKRIGDLQRTNMIAEVGVCPVTTIFFCDVAYGSHRSDESDEVVEYLFEATGANFDVTHYVRGYSPISMIVALIVASHVPIIRTGVDYFPCKQERDLLSGSATFQLLASRDNRDHELASEKYMEGVVSV